MTYLNARSPTDVSASTLPARFYTDPAWLREELEHIHYAMWLYAGRAERIVAPGDFFLVELGNASVLVVRDEAGQIRAHHNVCRHRGTLLCTRGTCRGACGAVTTPGRIGSTARSHTRRTWTRCTDSPSAITRSGRSRSPPGRATSSSTCRRTPLPSPSISQASTRSSVIGRCTSFARSSAEPTSSKPTGSSSSRIITSVYTARPRIRSSIEGRIT